MRGIPGDFDTPPSASGYSNNFYRSSSSPTHKRQDTDSGGARRNAKAKREEGHSWTPFPSDSRPASGLASPRSFAESAVILRPVFDLILLALVPLAWKLWWYLKEEQCPNTSPSELVLLRVTRGVWIIWLTHAAGLMDEALRVFLGIRLTQGLGSPTSVDRVYSKMSRRADVVAEVRSYYAVKLSITSRHLWFEHSTREFNSPLRRKHRDTYLPMHNSHLYTTTDEWNYRPLIAIHALDSKHACPRLSLTHYCCTRTPAEWLNLIRRRIIRVELFRECTVSSISSRPACLTTEEYRHVSHPVSSLNAFIYGVYHELKGRCQRFSPRATMIAESLSDRVLQTL